MIHYTVCNRRIATITLNRDDKRNAVNEVMAQQLLESLDRAEQANMRVIVLRANPNSKVWCAGHDVAELDLRDLHAQNPTLQVARRIQEVPCPVIAMVEGSVHGGAVAIVLSADIVIAAENADLSIASNKLGIPLPLDLHAYWLRVMGIHKVKEMLFTAATMSAQDAWNAGLYNHVVERGDLERVTDVIASKIIDCSAEAIASTKHQLNLIAQHSSLSDAVSSKIAQRTSDILDGKDTRRRVANLLATLQGD